MLERNLSSALLAFEQRHWGAEGSLGRMEDRLAVKVDQVRLECNLSMALNSNSCYRALQNTSNPRKAEQSRM